MLHLLAILASYRLAVLVTKERGPFDAATHVRSWALRASGHNTKGLLYEGITCMWCVSWWAALLCWALVTWGGALGAFLVAWWGIAGGALIADQLISAAGRERA